MTESICLHIQDRDSGPIRVVELPWISVRIGRAAHCEVRLTEPDLPEELCRLQRRGQSWRLLPGTNTDLVFLEGRRLGGACLLPFDVPFRAGRFCFTLRHDRSAEPDWELYAGPAPPRVDESEEPPVAEAEPEPQSEPPPEPPRAPLPAAPLRLSAERPIVDKRPEPKPWDTKPPGPHERWETRWKALAAQVKARAESNRKTPEVSRPSYQSDLEPIPVREARVPLVQPPLPSSFGPGLTPVSTLGAAIAWTEPRRARTAVEPERLDQQIDVATATTPSQQALRAPIAGQVANSMPIGPADGIDVELDLAEEPQEFPFEDTLVSPVLTHEEPLHSAPVIVFPDSVIDDAQSELEPIAIDQPLSPTVEPRAPVEGPDDKLIFLTDGSATIIPSTAVVVNEPDVDLEPWPKQVLPARAKNLEWPSAKDILATHRAVSSSRAAPASGTKTTTKVKRPGVIPTLSRAPSQWNPPVSLAGSAAMLFILSSGIFGCTLSWSWAHDSYMASIVTDRLLTSDRVLERSPLPDSVQPPENGWVISTSAHLATWAVFLSRFAGEDNKSPATTTALLERALAASPINAQARLAMAQLEPAGSTSSVSVSSLGLSRDAASLAWCARQLMAAGKKEDALKLYGRAISVAVPEKPSRSRVPRFSEDPGVPRYLLPGEEQVRDIVRELVSQNVWTFDEWSRVLSESPIVLITTARLLRAQGRGEAETVVDLILKERAVALAPGQTPPVTLAALAEAFALRSRFTEARQLYRQAIDLIDDPTIQRSWWFNLADIADRADDETERQAALRSASAVAFSDDITRRATDIQRATLTRSTGVKAN